MNKNGAPDPSDVLAEACRLAEELTVPPTQSAIAANLHCSQQHVSNAFMALEYAGKIEWVSRFAYRIVNSEWIPPTDVKV